MIEAPDAPHAHHSGHRWFDIAIAVAVVLASLGSLYVSLHTGATMEKLVEQNSRLVRANSAPLLEFDTGNISDEGKYEIYLAVRNAGTGPARIVWFELLEGGRPARNVADLLPQGIRLRDLGGYIITGSIAPSMIPAGEQRTLLTWAKPATGTAALPVWEQLDKSRMQLKVEACYCSLFDECWTTNAAADVPTPVATCEIGNRTSYKG